MMEIDIIGMGMKKSRDNTKITVLHRENGQWHNAEIVRIIRFLNTTCVSHPQYPEYLVLYGHWSKQEVSFGENEGVEPYTCAKITGMDNPALPFKISSFI